MNKIVTYSLRPCLLLLMVLCVLPLQARKSWTLADSLVERMRDLAPRYAKTVSEYRAELYVKGDLHVDRKNLLMQALPHMFHLQKGVRDYVVETHSDLHYTAPDIYDEKMRGFSGTAGRAWEADGRLQDFFHINVYASSLLGDKLLSPLAPNARKYYKYTYQGLQESEGRQVHRVYFVRKVYSYQLLYGYMLIDEESMTVREICYIGHTEMNHFIITVKLGEEGTDKELLPVRYEVEVNIKMLGNKMTGRYVGVPEYQEIDFGQSKKMEYDLTEAYALSVDTTTMIRDYDYISERRTEPLTKEEDALYQRYFQREDSLKHASLLETVTSSKNKFLEGMEDILFSRRTIVTPYKGTFRIYQLLDPSLLSYSRTNGVSYRYKIRYNQLFSGDRLLTVTPRLGVNFKHRELFWNVNSDLNYWPRRRQSISLEMGSGGRIYSPRITNVIDQIPDELIDKSQIHVDYFKDIYLKLMHSWEVTNGFTFQVGISAHQRSAPKKSRYVLNETGQQISPAQMAAMLPELEESDQTIVTSLRRTYNSFAPRVTLIWVPGQRYYMSGQRKENLDSKYPCVTLDWERGISGVLNNSMEYERLEFDIRQTFSLGAMRELYLRAGGGAFTHQKHLYFADFEHLRRNNLPDEWRDEISGRFQLLHRYMYNSSSRYARFHVTYDTPFLFVPHLTKLTKHVIYERVYLNMLYTSTLNPYWELGYGFGTHLVDLGFFASFEKTKYQRWGVKISYQLFKR